MVRAEKIVEQSSPARLAAHKKRVYGTTKLEICELLSAHILQLSFFPDQQRAIGMALKKHFDLSLPGFSEARFGKEVIVIRVEMSKIWVISQKPLPELPSLFDKFYPLIMTGSRSLIHISGENADALLKRLTSADLRHAAGHVFATSMHHIPVQLLKIKELDYILCIPRSYAESLANMIADISYQFNCAIAAPKRYQTPKSE